MNNKKNYSFERRVFLKDMAKLSLSFTLPLPAYSFASDNKQEKNNKKLIWIVLRGAMDSLHAIIPTNDPHLMTHRRLLVEPIFNDVLKLNSDFALHPNLSFCHSLYEKKECAPVVAVASPYRKRSHFDAQDILENGQIKIDHHSGWLGRALHMHHGEGLAIAQTTPMSLRGKVKTRTWYPSRFPDIHDDLYSRLQGLYQGHEILDQSIEEIIETKAKLRSVNASQKRRFVDLAASCGELLNQDKTAVCAMLELGGWDTHNAQARRLERQFTLLDDGLRKLKEKLADTWQDTLVIVASEFGRTVKVNGTLGSDHGTGTALLLAGGALVPKKSRSSSSEPMNASSEPIIGGKVYGEWPSLANKYLHEGRDLYPSTDMFSWIGLALKQHWGFEEQQLVSIFPDSVPRLT